MSSDIIAMLCIILFRISCVAGFVILCIKNHPALAIFLLVLTSMMETSYSVKSSRPEEKCKINTTPASEGLSSVGNKGNG